MGTCMSQLDSSFRILKRSRKPALEAIRALHATGRKFRWVDDDFNERRNLAAMLSEWGWEIESNAAGDVVGIEFQRSKIGDEDDLFRAMAPHVAAGSWIEVECEGASGHVRWRWTFDGAICRRDYDFEEDA